MAPYESLKSDLSLSITQVHFISHCSPDPPSSKLLLRFFLLFRQNHSHIPSQNVLLAVLEVLHFISIAQISLPNGWIMNQATIFQKAIHEQPFLILFTLLLALPQFLWPLSQSIIMDVEFVLSSRSFAKRCSPSLNKV